MLDDYVPGKVENSNKLEVSDVGQFKAFKYKYQSIKYQKKKATEVRDIQKDKNPNIIVWVSFHNSLTKFTLGDCLQMWRHRELDWDDVDCNDGGSENKAICQMFS